MKTDQKIIDIDETPVSDNRPQEVPSFSIEEIKTERVDGSGFKIIPNSKRTKRSIIFLLCALLLIIVALLAFLLLQTDAIRGNKGIQASVSDEKNLETLQAKPVAAERGTTVTADSVLGVAFDIYSLDGLRGSLENEIPDTTDKSLVLFLRSADYHPDGSIEGSFVMDGKRLKAKSRVERSGYVAISAEGIPVIGISSSDKVAGKMEETKGDFFRQFILLGDGRLPVNFYLHGKVERGAIGRKADGKLYYILTRHKETMYDFADALREYGFVDAIYVTGGNAYDFYRTPDGNAHISEEVKKKIDKYSTEPLAAPLLVFRAGK